MKVNHLKRTQVCAMGVVFGLTAWAVTPAQAATIPVAVGTVEQKVDHLYTINPTSNPAIGEVPSTGVPGTEFPSPNQTQAFSIEKAQVLALFGVPDAAGFDNPGNYALNIASPPGIGLPDTGPLAGLLDVFASGANVAPASAEWTLNYHNSSSLSDPAFHTVLSGTVLFLADSFTFEDFDINGVSGSGGTRAGGYSTQNYKVQLDVTDSTYHSVGAGDSAFNDSLLFEVLLYQDFWSNAAGHTGTFPNGLSFPTVIDDPTFWLNNGFSGGTSITSWHTAPVPLPAAAWMGLSLLGGLGTTQIIRRRRLAA